MRRDEIARNRGLKRKTLFKYQTERVREKWIFFYFRTCLLRFLFVNKLIVMYWKEFLFFLFYYYFSFEHSLLLLFVCLSREQRKQIVLELILFAQVQLYMGFVFNLSLQM